MSGQSEHPTDGDDERPFKVRPLQSRFCSKQRTHWRYQDLTGRVTKTQDVVFAIGGFSDVYKGEYVDESGVKHPVRSSPMSKY